jgi:hypothetical protein
MERRQFSCGSVKLALQLRYQLHKAILGLLMTLEDGPCVGAGIVELRIRKITVRGRRRANQVPAHVAVDDFPASANNIAESKGYRNKIGVQFTVFLRMVQGGQEQVRQLVDHYRNKGFRVLMAVLANADADRVSLEPTRSEHWQVWWHLDLSCDALTTTICPRQDRSSEPVYSAGLDEGQADVNSQPEAGRDFLRTALWVVLAKTREEIPIGHFFSDPNAGDHLVECSRDVFIAQFFQHVRIRYRSTTVCGNQPCIVRTMATRLWGSVPSVVGNGSDGLPRSR